MSLHLSDHRADPFVEECGAGSVHDCSSYDGCQHGRDLVACRASFAVVRESEAADKVRDDADYPAFERPEVAL